MRHLVVGAGASVAQASELGVPKEFWPPTMANFARKTWANYAPWPFLQAFLQYKGVTLAADSDPREDFYVLEQNGNANIEQFIEFAWSIKDNLPSEWHGAWNGFMRFGIGDPIALLINQGFQKHGIDFVDLPVTRRMLSRFTSDDLILSLNYDTLVEIGLQQNETNFTYLPNVTPAMNIPVCKPHGSLNMAFDENGFSFGDPRNLFPLFQTGDPRLPYVGLIPPRLNKTYEQTPMARKMLLPVESRAPQSIVMWGIGMTESDIDLNEIYRGWAKKAEFVDVINPDPKVAPLIETVIGLPVRRFAAADEWLQQE
ncbi:hypothetical protein [Rhizobium sp. YTU87027]|uniref:hypothetical protein n=1 Tax=Rhizobium sp. YTU87027 TaxID=3417741 RepID=UPI003D68446D